MTRGTVILDVDGTLADSNDAHARAWVEAFAEAGITVPFDRVRRSIGMGGDKLMPAVAGIEEDSPEGARIAERRGEIFRSRYLPHIGPLPGSRALVSKLLADGFRIAVASSAKDDELTPLLERAGVADLIGARTSSDDAEESKPDPDIIRAAMEKVSADAERTVMVGDTPYDIVAAGRAGIRAIAFESGGWSSSDLRGAVAVYADAADLVARYDSSPLAGLKEADGRR